MFLLETSAQLQVLYCIKYFHYSEKHFWLPYSILSKYNIQYSFCIVIILSAC